MARRITFIRGLRLVARAWSILSITFILAIFGGELFSSARVLPGPQEMFGLALFPGGVCLGLLLAWRWEGWGGILTLLSLAAFYFWNYLQSGLIAGGPFFILLAAPGLLFVCCCYLERKCPTDYLGIRRMS